jgi:4-pyridoxolactonase
VRQSRVHIPSRSAPMRVSVLASGSMLIDHSQLYWNHDPGRSVRHPVYAVLVEHPDGRVLIDTGFDIEHVRSGLPFVEPLEDLGGPVQAGLRAAGAGFADIDYVVHTHLHFDHVGGDRMLDGPTVFVHKEEIRHARVPEPFESLSYSNQDFGDGGVTLELIDADTEVLPGIWMLETPGHSAGHCSVLLTGTSGRELLLCGDAAYTRGNLERRVISGFHLDPVESVRSIDRLRRLAGPDTVTLLFPHDMEDFATYPISPAHWDI